MRRTEIAPGPSFLGPGAEIQPLPDQHPLCVSGTAGDGNRSRSAALLMERGYADCPDMTQMTKKLARLYGADLTVDARPLGANHNLCVSVTGIKDRFALEGEALTREYAALALARRSIPILWWCV